MLICGYKIKKQKTTEELELIQNKHKKQIKQNRFKITRIRRNGCGVDAVLICSSESCLIHHVE